MTQPKQMVWTKKRRDLILRIISEDVDRAALSAEALVTALHLMHIKNHRAMRFAPPIEKCGLTVTTIRKDMEYLEYDGYLDVRYARHTIGSGKVPRFKVAFITTAGNRRVNERKDAF